MRNTMIMVVLVCIAAASSGCTIQRPKYSLEGSIKTAFIMYTEGGLVSGPRPYRREDVEEHDLEAFLADMIRVLGTKYTPGSLYSIAWFGNSSHLEAVAPFLTSENQEERGVGIAGISADHGYWIQFSRLSAGLVEGAVN